MIGQNPVTSIVVSSVMENPEELNYGLSPDFFASCDDATHGKYHNKNSDGDDEYATSRAWRS